MGKEKGRKGSLSTAKVMDTLNAGGVLKHLSGESEEELLLEVKEIPIAMIKPNPFQARQTFREESLQELSISIQEQGFYGTLLARQKGRKFELAFGERRLRAAALAGLEKVPLLARDLTDEQMMEIGITENVQREDLNPVEEAQAYARLRDELNLKVREIAAKIGKSKSYVNTLLSIIRYEDVAEAVRNADIPVRTAEELAKFEDEALRSQLIQQVIDGKLDRQGLIELRKQGEEGNESTPPTSSSRPGSRYLSNFRKTLKLLTQSDTFEVTSEEEAEEVVTLLRDIVDSANEMLKRFDS